LRLPYDFVQPANRVKRLLGQLAFVGRMQIEELAAGMRHAADFSDALLEACFVAGEVVAHQLAIPLAKEVARMFARTTRAEVINHCLERRKRRSAVSLNVGTMGFLLARRERLHRRFVSVDHALGKYRFA
jgi:aminoglycoside phosphotransferase family enzyme